MKLFIRGVTLAATVAASPVLAQGPPTAEVAGGYQWMRDGSSEQTFPRGWFVSGASVVSSRAEGRVSIVGELGEHRLDERLHAEGLSVDIGSSQLAYLAGVRFGRVAGAVRPFVQALAGVARLSVTVAITHLDGGFDLSDTVLVVQPGGGVDFALSERAAIRLMADYRYLGEGSFQVEVDTGLRVSVVEGDSISTGFGSGNAVRVGAGLVVTF